MDADEKTIALFTTRVRQLILQYNELKNDNAVLRSQIAERDSAIAQLKQELSEAHEEYDRLKIAKMVTITNGDLESAQKRISKLIRDVSKCITLISEK